MTGGTGSSARGVDEGGTSVAGASTGGTAVETGTSAGGAGSTVDTTTVVVVTTGEEADGGSSSGSAGSFRPVAAGLTEDTRTVSVTVAPPTTRVCVATRAARASRAAPCTTTVSVTVASETPVSNGSVHHWEEGREGGGAARGPSEGVPVNAISANIPPSAKKGTTTTAPKHPRPLRGSSR